MSIYPYCQEILPASVVEYSLEARITSAQDVNLVIARGSTLQIYSLVESSDENSDEIPDDETVNMDDEQVHN